jgi:hypothetical protein
MGEKRRFEWLSQVMLRILTLTMVFAAATAVAAQETANRGQLPSPITSQESVSDSVRELREQVQELQEAVAGMRTDWQRARAETLELRRQLDEVRAASGTQTPSLRDGAVKSESNPEAAMRTSQDGLPKGDTADPKSADQKLADQKSADPGSPYQDQSSADQRSNDNREDQKTSERAARLEEQFQLLSGKVDDQYQTKVESASKYPLRISGIVLMNLASTQGSVDSIDLPTLAYARPAGNSGGSFSATLRQSQIGFEAFGPDVAGAKTRADLQLDLAGGFATVPNGVNSGLLRLRTGTIRMDWANTSVVVGQDALFFSPNSPTSFASLAVPALSYAGNLWSWVPQIRVEHRISLGEESSLLFQGGILDPLSGEVPSTGFYRQAGPGESSRQPAYGTRVAWSRNVFGQPLRVGMGGFYSRQDYGFSRTLDSWAGMADLDIPLNHALSLSGKLYRGRGVGGLFGGIGTSAVFSGNPSLPDTEVHGLNSVGGWAQLKYRPADKLEFNAAFGMDNPYAADLKYFPYAQAYNPTLARNQGSFVNVIYRPRSDILFSAEYRHLTTYTISNGGYNASHLNLMMGVLF